jgi:lysophospholipase L1-like esterase
LVRACHPATRVFFALQPIAGVTKPHLTEEEKYLFELYSRTDKIWSRVVEQYAARVAKGYSQTLRQLCGDLGVPYTDLNDLDYEGWCFLDYGHMTDNGYRQVAEYLAGWMRQEAGKQENK